jgi:hypothetical protein
MLVHQKLFSQQNITHWPHIPRPWNGSAAMDEVLFLQTSTSVWAQIGWTFPNFFDQMSLKN